MNALNVVFQPERSYVYSWLIRGFCLPFHSLVPLVALQALAGAVVAWLLAFALIRYLGVRWQIAAAAGLAFAWDPVQVVNEHLIMTETSAGLVAALFLLSALEYLRDPRNPWLVALAFLGGLLVSLRVVYIPLVFACAVLIPLAGFPALAHGRRRRLAAALAVSVAAVAVCQEGYQMLTGHWANREPGYEYKTGFFLAGNLAPLLKPQDAADPRAAAALREQQRSDHPLSDTSFEARNSHLWDSGGLVNRLRSAFSGDEVQASRQAERMALRAVARNPLGFLGLGFKTWQEYQVLLRKDRFWAMIILDDGLEPGVQPTPRAWQLIAEHFPNQRRDQTAHVTPSQRYHRLARHWCWLQYLTPFLGLGATALARRGTRRAMGFLTLWSAMLLAVTCLTTPAGVRYLHPFSFMCLAAIGVIGERLVHAVFDARISPEAIRLSAR
jgi:hypothetical protein